MNDNPISPLIDLYKNQIYSLCIKLCHSRDKADDLFQSTWLSVADNIDKINHAKNILNYIYTICLNIYRKEYVKEKRRFQFILDYFHTDEEKSLENIPDHFSIEDYFIDKDNHATVETQIDQLDDKYRIPILLFFYKDKSYQEIADIMNLPLSTIKYRLNMAKKLLKKGLEDIGYEPYY